MERERERRPRRRILLVGGIGRMERHYRTQCGRAGYDLLYAETESQMPAVSGRADGSAAHQRASNNLDAVLVVTSTASHKLRHLADQLGQACGVPIAYLAGPSVSCLRRGLEGLS